MIVHTDPYRLKLNSLANLTKDS